MQKNNEKLADNAENWIVDPIKQRVTVYFFEKELVAEYSFEEVLPFGIYKDFSIKIQ